MTLSSSKRSAIALLVVLTSLAIACSTDMNSDLSGSQMQSGITEARSGTARVQTGIDEFNAGSSQTAVTDISLGIDMANHGITQMHDAMGMMSGGMMMHCVDGAAAAALAPMQSATDAMSQGQAKLSDNQADNDTEGIRQVTTGCAMMNSALDQAQADMNCMGHGHMMM